MTARVQLESLLKARKLDVTLTTATPWRTDSPHLADLASTGVPSIDASLGGGLRRGHLSEIVGGRSSGRTTVVCQALGAAASRGELVALVDTCDRFDPVSASDAGLDLSRLLWIRDTGDAFRSLKAMNLVLQAGGFGLVVFDLADVAARTLRTFPFTTWFRLARVIEGSQTVALLMTSEHLARSAGGVTLALDARPRARWSGHSDRARLLRGVEASVRVIGGNGGHGEGIYTETRRDTEKLEGQTSTRR
jgi:recombination protein RecA